MYSQTIITIKLTNVSSELSSFAVWKKPTWSAQVKFRWSFLFGKQYWPNGKSVNKYVEVIKIIAWYLELILLAKHSSVFTSFTTFLHLVALERFFPL